MYCISVSYKNTTSMVRNSFAFTNSQQIQFLTELKDRNIITGGVVVSTCNRSEIYVNLVGRDFEAAENFLSEFKGIDIELIRNIGFYYEGKGALRHLMRVTAGLDSMLLGEDEILHQVKEAYLNAFEAGLTDGDINMIFQGAFNSAKLVKTDTDLSKTAVSYGTLSANEIQKFMQDTQVVKTSYVLVIGAMGKMGSILVKNLIDKGITVVGTSRTHGVAISQIYDKAKRGGRIVPFADRYEYINNAAAVVCCTASPHYVLSYSDYLRATANDTAVRLLIDLAIPYDIDRQIASLSKVRFLDIDYFKNLAKDNEAHKLSEKQKADIIIEKCEEDLMKKLYIRRYLPMITDKNGSTWNEKNLYDIKDSMDSETLLNVLKGLSS